MAYISLKDTKLLAQKSGNRCALCKNLLSLKETPSDRAEIIGECAHICGEKPDAARYNEAMSVKERNGADNLIYICPTCHTKIDKQDKSFSVEHLHELKKDHETWVEGSLLKAMTQVTFIELQQVVSFLLEKPSNSGTDFAITPLNEKIQKNGLSLDIHGALTMGLAKSSEVEKFIASASITQADFAERLKAGFIQKYFQFKYDGFEGDSLFYELVTYSAGGASSFKHQAAALSVIAYFFEKCEIFEK